MKKVGCDRLAERRYVLAKNPQACLQVSFQNNYGISVAIQPWVFEDNKLVPPNPCIIRVIRGSKAFLSLL
jgi:hypothetical protein